MAKARLGNAFEAMSGTLGNNVLSNDQDGTGVRSHNPVSKQPFTPKQLAREAAFTKANQTWTTLDAATAQEWRTYAASQRVRNPLTGKYRTRAAKDVFVGLYASLLGLGATHALPQVPAETFAGDPFAVGTLFEDGQLRFESTGANSAHVVTVLSAQRLPSANALPTKDGYRILGTKTYTTTDHDAAFDVAPGYWACACSFLNTLTGQTTPEVAIGVQRITLAVVRGGADAAPARAKKAA